MTPLYIEGASTFITFIAALARRIESQAAELATLLDGVGPAELPPMVMARTMLDLDRLASELERIGQRLADAGPGDHRTDHAVAIQR